MLIQNGPILQDPEDSLLHRNDQWSRSHELKDGKNWGGSGIWSLSLKGAMTEMWGFDRMLQISKCTWNATFIIVNFLVHLVVSSEFWESADGSHNESKVAPNITSVLICVSFQWWRHLFMCNTDHIRSYNVKSHWKVQEVNSAPE